MASNAENVFIWGRHHVLPNAFERNDQSWKFHAYLETIIATLISTVHPVSILQDLCHILHKLCHPKSTAIFRCTCILRYCLGRIALFPQYTYLHCTYDAKYPYTSPNGHWWLLRMRHKITYYLIIFILRWKVGPFTENIEDYRIYYLFLYIVYIYIYAYQ